jgi:hypothetical protein
LQQRKHPQPALAENLLLARFADQCAHHYIFTYPLGRTWRKPLAISSKRGPDRVRFE